DAGSRQTNMADRNLEFFAAMHTVPVGGAMTKNTSAAVADSFDSVSDRVAPVRIFHWDFNHLLLLALAEVVVIVLAFYSAMSVRFPDATFAQWPLFWLHTAIIGGMVFLGMACMGLYQLRQRTRFTGVVARLLVAVIM